MPAAAIILIFISALAHSLWNLTGKRNHPSAAYFLAASLAAGTALGPLVWYSRALLPAIPLTVWGLLLLTGCAQAIYYSAMAGAYRRLDLSLVYPIVRALPVALVAVASLLFGRASQIQPLGLSGMILIVFGCLLVPLQGLRCSTFGPAPGRGLLLAVLAALGTMGYMLTDDAALRILRNTPSIPLSPFWIAALYLALQTIVTILFLAVWVLFNRGERKHWLWVRQSTWRSATLTGLVISGGYLMVLLSMELASNVSYVTAFRQVSIPIGAALGIRFLHERAYPLKILGITLMLIGLVLVGIG
jgi:drug/metabolite transporter (DMT)-like permease